VNPLKVFAIATIAFAEAIEFVDWEVRDWLEAKVEKQW